MYVLFKIEKSYITTMYEAIVLLLAGMYCFKFIQNVPSKYRDVAKVSWVIAGVASLRFNAPYAVAGCLVAALFTHVLDTYGLPVIDHLNDSSAPAVVHIAPSTEQAMNIGHQLVEEGLTDSQDVDAVISDPRAMMIAPKVYVNEKGARTIVRPNIVVGSVVARVKGVSRVISPRVAIIDSENTHINNSENVSNFVVHQSELGEPLASTIAGINSKTTQNQGLLPGADLLSGDSYSPY